MFYLHNSLPKTNKISSDSDRSRAGHRNCDDFVVRQRRFSGDASGAAQVFDADVVVVADDRRDLVATLIVVLKKYKEY